MSMGYFGGQNHVFPQKRDFWGQKLHVRQLRGPSTKKVPQIVCEHNYSALNLDDSGFLKTEKILSWSRDIAILSWGKFSFFYQIFFAIG